MRASDLHEATLCQTLDDGTVICQACKLYCKIKPDRIGICGVRVNRDGKMYLLVYGKASAVNIDPVEKKPLYHFLPGSRDFFPGYGRLQFWLYVLPELGSVPGHQRPAQTTDEGKKNWRCRAGSNEIRI